MPYILVFSLTIGIVTLTHSLAMILIFLLVVYIVSRYEIWRFTRKDRVIYYSLILVALLSVIFYDYRVLWSMDKLISSYRWISIEQRLSGEEKFIVTQRERSGRYTIENMIDIDPAKQGRNQDFLLYTSQSLRPWDIILTKKEPLWRKYYPEFCILICRQSGQVLDNGWFDYDRWLYMQWLEWSFYDNNVFVSDHQDLWWLVSVRESFFQTVVERFGDGLLRTLPPRVLPSGAQWRDKSDTHIHAWLILGMTIGDRSLIDPARYDQFISSGLVHLIAVSGGNIAIVVLFVWMLLFWVPFYIRQIILIGAIISYACIVGDDSSVIRATVMWLLTLIVLFPWRQLSIWRSLAYARCGMLLRDPYYLLYDMWFILSFSAVIGIVWAEKKSVMLTLFQYLNKERFPPMKQGRDPETSSGWHKTWIASYLAMTNNLWRLMMQWLSQFILLYIVPTLWAMVWVTPWLLYSMETTNLISPIVNIAIVPLVPLITIGSFIVPYLPGWMWWDSIIIWCMDYIWWLSSIGTQYGIYLSLEYWSKIVLLSVMLLYWIYWIDKQVTTQEISDNKI